MKRFVITGGPCAGKTSALSLIKEYFEKKGKKVSLVSETASELIKEGLMPFGDTVIEFHSRLIQKQIEKEDAFSCCDIMVCDRGALDIKAYLCAKELEETYKAAGKDESGLIERYDAVFHLVSTAIGAEKFYTLENNAARSESISQAKELDEKSKKAWQCHPCRYIIDNSTDFDGKVKRLIKLIEEVL